ncbi:unnamed protein product [Effrenium voratum]|nr:unnamed protein product [Effrenium voratum]
MPNSSPLEEAAHASSRLAGHPHLRRRSASAAEHGSQPAQRRGSGSWSGLHTVAAVQAPEPEKGLARRERIAMAEVRHREGQHEGALQITAEVNEVFLLHGTKPETVKHILNDGLNERFSGGLFGSGSYLAEDPEKSDQYATVDRDGKMLPTDLSTECRSIGDVFYIFVCRTLLGWFVQTKDGETHLQSGLSIWSTRDKRELSYIPGVEPQMTFQSLQVEIGGRVHRNREYILTHSERIYPEYLIAYSRS